MAFPPDVSFPPLDPLDVSPVLGDALVDDERITPLPQGPFADHYEVIRELGAGGMGIVHLAYDRRAQRNVALKRVRRSFAGCLERFRREYRALAAIKHRGVPAIYDIGEAASGEPFFTMEIISGETIRAHLRRGPIAPLRALALAIDLGRVLMAVHEVGVIHRDVKPDNVILETGDRVRLIDFGAVLLTEDYYSQPHLLDVTDVRKRWRTRQTDVIGAAAYTCPIWLQEGKVSPRTDVFSVCVLLYEMITGRLLFSEETYRHREIRPEEFAPELAPLVTELRRGVSIIDSERHRTMADLVRALEIVRSDLAGCAKRPAPLWWAGAVVGASVASFMLGAVAAGSVLLGMPSSTPPVESGQRATCGSALPTHNTAAETPSDVPAVEQMPAAPSAATEAPPLPRDDTQAAVVGETTLDAARTSTTPKPPTRSSVTPWEARMRRAEVHARRCLENTGRALEPLTVAIEAGAPARVRGFASDAAETRCVRDALERFDLRVAEGQRMHTFFAPRSRP